MSRDGTHLQREADAQLNRSLSLTSWQLKLEDDMKLWLLHALAACHTEGPQETGRDCLLLMEHLRGVCRVQGLCSLGWPLRLVFPGNNGKPGTAPTCCTTSVCSHGWGLGWYMCLFNGQQHHIVRKSAGTMVSLDCSSGAVLERSQQPLSLSSKAPHHLDLSACCLYAPPPSTFTGLFPFFPQNPAWLTCLTLLRLSLCLQWHLFLLSF